MEEFESRASLLTEKLNGLQHRLELIIPTRSSTAYSPTASDQNSTSVMTDFYLSSEESQSIRSNDENHTQQLVRVLHPLQAAEEDYSAYDRNFKQLQSEFQTLTDGDLQLFWQYLENDIPSQWHTHPKVIWRKNQLSQLHTHLNAEFEQSDVSLTKFRRGFAFARMCLSIRQELDMVQNKMVKSITTHNDIQDLELSMEKTSGMVITLQDNFHDLLQVPSTAEEEVDDAYLKRFQVVQTKNELVRSWVEEVRVWFAEAERIKQWIEIRIEQLNDITIPDPLTSVGLPASREEMENLNAVHSVLEKEIEAFDKEDMARLRSHVKTLTGSGRADKDLSPADTTTIEITLTTLMTLDKLMHSLRKKKYDLQVLTQRVIWEEEYAISMEWLKTTDADIDAFLMQKARWRPSEQENSHGDLKETALKREMLMAQEKQKETIIQQLLSLERKLAEFDSGQFTVTVESFQDLDNTSTVELPHHLESRQEGLEQFFEDMMKRMTFTRNVVEQRLNVMDFLYQTELVINDAFTLQMDLADAETNIHPGDNDREMTARVQNMHEMVVQLVTATAGRIPYPVPGLEIDRDANTKANEEISKAISQKRNDLVLLSEDLDERLHTFRNVLQLHRRAKEYSDNALNLIEWADERIKVIRRAKLNQEDASSLTAEDLQRLERDRDSIIKKLKNDKENEVIDLLTRISLLLETTQKLKISSIDREGLNETSQQLQERFDRLQQILEEHGLDLEALRKKMEDGNTYFEQARALKLFIQEIRHGLPSLKQTCGFMTGQSEEQDNRRFDMLNQSLSKIKSDYADYQQQFVQLCTRFKVMEASKVENMDELCTTQSELETDWTQLQKEIEDLEQFSDIVGEWYKRQRRLSMIEKEYLAGMNEDIANLAHSGWQESDLDALQERITTASNLLEEIGEGIKNSQNNEDPLQTANYSCARDRYLMLSNKVQTALTSLNSLRSDANHAVALTAFLRDADKLRQRIQEHKEMMARRMADVGNSGFASDTVDAINTCFKESQTSNAASEKEYQQLIKRLDNLLEEKAKVLGTSVAATESVDQVKENLNQLLNTIQLEKKQAMFVRKMFIHAKAANDLQTWIDHCSEAIAQLPTDVCMHDEQELREELDNLEQKIIEMRPTIQAFEAMESRILSTKDGEALDLCELSLDRNDIKSAVKNREGYILKKWNDLKDQHARARQSVDQSKQGVEIARKMKAILTQIGDMKDRVSAVRICRNTQLDDGLENRDLNTVLSCPLTSIPTEHRLASAKAELDILDRDIESHLQPLMQELDRMLNVMSESNQDIFNGQRTEITVAVRGLTDLMKIKRRAIAEAEKMEGFLTVMEELEVLLLALAEVVSRASPENARIVDGQYSRTDLQALLIDLDTRYRYYEPKINELFDEANEVAENLLDDRRVVDCLAQLSDRWSQLQQEAEAKKADLMQRIGPLADTFDSLEMREGILKERGRKAANLIRKQSSPVLKQPPSPKSMQSTPRPTNQFQHRNTRNTTTPIPFALSATAARANARRTTGGTAVPSERRVLARQTAAQQQRLRAITKTPETYVADPKNDLDVALGDIVNDSPYKVQVKMVPGEVGKYWFGDVNPKLAYCRILRSRMVMVRVGGGWVELSQFLRDHALLEGTFVSGTSKNSRASLPPTPGGIIRDGFLNTTVGRNPPGRINQQPNGVVSIRGGGAGQENNAPQLRESRSTPYGRGISPGPYGHGIKTGNKFLVTVDQDGNRVEVKMTKAKSKDTKFVTPRRYL